MTVPIIIKTRFLGGPKCGDAAIMQSERMVYASADPAEVHVYEYNRQLNVLEYAGLWAREAIGRDLVRQLTVGVER